jgi:hypothetical protein
VLKEKDANVVPDETAEWIKGLQTKTWEVGKDDAIWSSPPVGEPRSHLKRETGLEGSN